MFLRFSIILLLFFQICHSFRPNHQVNRQCQSIFSNERYQETFTPARYSCAPQMNINSVNQAISERILPDQYFPETECPTSVMDTYNSYFGNGETNAFLGSFPDDVKASFKNIIDMNKKAIEEQKKSFINDFVTNVKTCTPVNNIPSPQNEEATVTMENAEANSGGAFVTEQKGIEQIIISEIESESESEVEFNVINNEVTVSNSSDTQIDYIAENQSQSWESVQFSSEEIN